MMRAKLKVIGITDHRPEFDQVSLKMMAVGPSSYPEDGTDENNTFARWTPAADLTMEIMNPGLLDAFHLDQTFYVDFTEADL